MNRLYNSPSSNTMVQEDKSTAQRIQAYSTSLSSSPVKDYLVFDHPHGSPSIKTTDYIDVRPSTEKHQFVQTHRRSASVQSERMSWGVNSTEEHYQTSYESLFNTQDKSSSIPRTRALCPPPDNLSISLIPAKLNNSPRLQKNGACNYSKHRRMRTEGDDFLQNLGERAQSITKLEGIRIIERNTNKSKLADEHRFHQLQTEPSQREHSESRMVKNILEYQSPPNRIIGSNAYTQDLTKDDNSSSCETQVMTKIGPGYSSVLRKLNGDKPQGRRQYAVTSKGDSLKTLMTHSFQHEEEQTIAITTSQKREMLEIEAKMSLRKNTKPQTGYFHSKVMHNSLNKELKNISQSDKDQKVIPSKKDVSSGNLKIQLHQVSSGKQSLETSIIYEEGRIKAKERRQQRSTAGGDSTLTKMTQSVSISATNYTAAQSRERSKPDSLQTVTASVSGRASAVGQETTTKQRPEDKKSPLKTQNEKKFIQGISKSSMPKKLDVQKFMAMAAMGILSSSNKVQTRRK